MKLDSIDVGMGGCAIDRGWIRSIAARLKLLMVS